MEESDNPIITSASNIHIKVEGISNYVILDIYVYVITLEKLLLEMQLPNS